jgi:hypothetical protein
MVVECRLSPGMYFPNISRRSSEEARLCRRLTLLPVPESRDRGDDDDDDDGPGHLRRPLPLPPSLLLLSSSSLAGRRPSVAAGESMLQASAAARVSQMTGSWSSWLQLLLLPW